MLNVARHAILVSGTAVLVLAGCGTKGATNATGGTGTDGGTGDDAASGSQVRLVGTYNGMSGAYTTIQSAVDAASPGDWILVAPGDYHETEDLDHPPTPEMASAGGFGGVLVTKAGLHIRGMDRNTTIIDGDKAGSSAPCDSAAQYQTFGSADAMGNPIGRNGIVVYQAD